MRAMWLYVVLSWLAAKETVAGTCVPCASHGTACMSEAGATRGSCLRTTAIPCVGLESLIQMQRLGSCTELGLEQWRIKGSVSGNEADADEAEGQDEGGVDGGMEDDWEPQVETRETEHSIVIRSK